MYPILKRIFDILSSITVLMMFLPIFIIIGLLIIIDSPGGMFYKQKRIGLNGKEFGLYKFRSMKTNADKEGQITIGNDSRVTKIGSIIRKFKLDEIPQLINIIIGHMSVVGPRPEVEKYVKLYNETQLKVLTVKPGLTDLASIEFINEQDILGKSKNPNETYINEIMPAKLKLNLKYINERNFFYDLGVIFKTILKIFR